MMCIYDTTYSQISLFFFFFNDTATTEIYTLSLHDALPIFELRNGRRLQKEHGRQAREGHDLHDVRAAGEIVAVIGEDRKSTRLNSSHANISYAVFCLKKKKKKI